MGLFEQFPYSNFHQLNLDWLIKAVKDLGDHAVLSVNGQTGDVVLYKSENIVFPEVDSDTWRMVRVADGHTAGVMFQNGLLYVMYDNVADRAYTINHPPVFPVTSVNGQTGAVETYSGAYNRLPAVADQNTNFYRTIDKDGSPVDVGIQVDKNKAERMAGVNRYKIYDEGNTPNLVTSVNGQSGTVVIAVPFEDVQTSNVMFSDASNEHYWSIGRETLDGVASIQLETSATGAEVYLRFFTEDDPPVSYVRKLLTIDDIPSSSGVVSVNGLTGVVTLYGNTMPIESGSLVNTKQYIDALTDQIDADIAWVETGNTATHNIPRGYYVVWNGVLCIATSSISINDALSNANLTPINYGLANDLHDKLFLKAGDTIYTDSFEIVPAIITGSLKRIHFTIPCSKNMEYVNGATLTSFTAGVRVPAGGYLNADNYDYLANSDNVIVSLDKHSGTIKISVNNEDGWSSSISNNTPLVASCNYILTFN